MLYELKLFILLLLCAQSQAQTYVVGTSYFGANGYIEYIPGDIPIILGQPHDGEIGDPNTSGTPPGTGLIDLPYIHDRGNDNYTKELIPELNDYLIAKTNGKRPHIVINHLYTGILNLVLEKDEAAGDNPEVRNAWDEYHDFMEVAKAEIMQTWGKGHYFEIHGNGVANQWTMVGLGLRTSELDSSESDIIIDAQTDSTIMNLANTPGVDVMEAIRGNTSIAGVLNARGWKSSPSPQYPSNENNETYFFAGWNTWEHSLRRPVKIDASHIENYWGFMTSANRDAYADDLSDAMLIYMKEHYNFDFQNTSLSVNKLEISQNKARIFPNPVSSTVTIQNAVNTTLNVYDINGSVVFTKIISSESETIDLSGLATGIYYGEVIEVTSVSVIKIVKN